MKILMLLLVSQIAFATEYGNTIINSDMVPPGVGQIDSDHCYEANAFRYQVIGRMDDGSFELASTENNVKPAMLYTKAPLTGTGWVGYLASDKTPSGFTYQYRKAVQMRYRGTIRFKGPNGFPMEAIVFEDCEK